MSTPTHAAVVTVSVGGLLAIHQVPTPELEDGEVQVRVEWTASTPLDLHQNDGGLLVNHPQVLGDGTAGTVSKVGPGVTRLKVGDKVSRVRFSITKVTYLVRFLVLHGEIRKKSLIKNLLQYLNISLAW